MIKKFAIYGFTLIAGFIFIESTNKTAGGHPSSTGAPGEASCSKPYCHDDGSVTLNSDKNIFVFDNFSKNYTPGETYDISLELDLADTKKAGFQIVAIDSTLEKNIGTWVLTEPDRMHIISGEAPFTSRTYITHSTLGSKPLSNQKNIWKFKWTAPNQNVGAIKFYMAVNATNNNDQTTGDNIHLSHYIIRPNATSNTNITEVVKPKVYIGNNQLHIHNISTHNAEIWIYSLDGKRVFHAQNISNESQIDLNLLNLRLNTTYIYQLRTESGTFAGKFQI